MEDTNTDPNSEPNYPSGSITGETITGEKRKREGKSRSIVWQHFTKLTNEEGICDKCQCNHCQKLFTCSSRSGTTHLLRHITDGICPIVKIDKETTLPVPSYTRGGLLQWKFEQGPVPTHTYDVQTPPTYVLPSIKKIPQNSALKSQSQPKVDVLMDEFKNCVSKLVDLANGGIPVGSIPGPPVSTSPDYSIAATLRCLNEMDDIPQSSEMYLDAFEILQDVGERECFISLPPEPRRRWLQRILHRRHPLRYSSNLQ